MHIGLIGGIGPAATEFYYRGLIDRHAKSGTRLELTIANAEVRDLSQNLANKDARKQAEIFVVLITRLKAAGALALIRSPRRRGRGGWVGWRRSGLSPFAC